jgi:hypothetical protein
MPLDLQLTPLPFHDALRTTLRDLEPGLWSWFSSDAFGKKYADDVRLELLRSTYRMPREQHAALYDTVDEIRVAFGIEAAATLYQAQEDGPMNAGLVFVPGELHVVFRGPVTTKLTDLELRALLGHELAHHKLWIESDGAYRVANALIEDAAAHGSSPSHVQSALRFRLWTEIYADRAGLLACDDLASAVACLVKVGTGLDRVDGLAYLEQAKEALAAKDTKSEGRTHPETFIRAFALESWANGGDFSEIERLVAGPVEIDALDLVQQHALTRTTRRLVDAILAPEALRTEATLAHARRFFPDFSAPSASSTSQPHGGADEPPLDFANATESVAEYVAYVLLDFAVADHEIDDLALAHAASLATALGIKAAFRKIAKKELKLSAAALAELEGRGIRLDTEPPPAVATEVAS